MKLVSYGILNSQGGFVCSSTTKQGAKNKATRDGVTEVYAMHNVSWAVWKVAEKVNGKWVNI